MTTDRLSFSIQHPDLSSSLIAPVGALTAELVSISCCISINKKKRNRETKRKRRDSNAQLMSTEDKAAVENFVSSVASDTNEEMPCLWTTRDDDLIRAKYLIQGIIAVLFTGSTRNGPAVKVLENNPAHCLSRLMPSVLHGLYLKVSFMCNYIYTAIHKSYRPFLSDVSI